VRQDTRARRAKRGRDIGGGAPRSAAHNRVIERASAAGSHATLVRAFDGTMTLAAEDPGRPGRAGAPRSAREPFAAQREKGQRQRGAAKSNTRATRRTGGTVTSAPSLVLGFGLGFGWALAWLRLGLGLSVGAEAPRRWVHYRFHAGSTTASTAGSRGTTTGQPGVDLLSTSLKGPPCGDPP